MAENVGTPTRISASGIVRTGFGNLVGVLVNSSTSGLLTLYDGTAASGTPFVNALALTAGDYRAIPANFGKGLYATIGGTADVTFFIDA
jgi:hypothetical protein